MSRRAWLVAVLVPALAGCPSFHRGALPGEPRDARFAELEGARVRYLDTEGSDTATKPADTAPRAEGAIASPRGVNAARALPPDSSELAV